MEEIIDQIKNNKLNININNNNFKKIQSNLKSEILSNKKIILKANNIDNEIINKMIDINKFINIINSYEFKSTENTNNDTEFIIYNGNPYITLNLCMQAIITNKRIVLLYDEFMLGVNTILISIIKTVLQDFKMDKLILEKENKTNIKLYGLERYFSKVIVIGNSTYYQLLKFENKVFFPYNNIILYYDDEKYEEISRAVEEYSFNVKEELEIIYEDNIDEVIDYINGDNFSNIAVLFSSNIENQKKFKLGIKNKTVIINSNPYKNETITNCNNIL